VLGAIWQVDTQIWWGLPITLLVWTWDIFDLLLDLLFVGVFFWAKPIAYIFIWIINILQLPINFIGWIWQFTSALMKVPIEFWMWFFGDGCFLMWGKNCWTSMIPEHRSAVTALDISIFLADTKETDADVDTEEIGPRPEGPEFPAFTQNSSFS